MYTQKNLPLLLSKINEPLNGYKEFKPTINQLYEQLLPYLPLLRKLNKQKKWQLWLINAPHISRFFVESLGLTAGKIILLPFVLHSNYANIMQQALLNGNFSYILSCATQPLPLTLSQDINQHVPIFQIYPQKTRSPTQACLDLIMN